MPIQAGEIAVASEVAEALDGWISYSPLLYSAMATTPVSIARTVTAARYVERGGLVIVQANIVANAASSGGVGVQLPIAAVTGIGMLGSGVITGSGAPATQSGCAFLSGTDKVTISLPSTAFLDVASGQRVQISLAYQS
ncbi:hypothetical protein GCM10010168_85790 [Actinoplanes ianthinogenes]|uniref:Uncharacterized protein n=1 Tax=Actinoplanes ianthinogenes TaxID=122358 RepID=A0ABM7M1C9_9ACTN|nr:hypothetical protein [Actinoplanes ianthinogenes]BCJ45310.1 hypothetical protein Aiant_59670 [Actinoplanes ianthinogenes]GGR53704.1 hypothetical protein GCM10010168_85790 [Actinoplanes ianthinogenes]